MPAIIVIQNSYFSFMQLANKKIYFASDQHFGAPTAALSLPRKAIRGMAR
jgi:hypothetical protein